MAKVKAPWFEGKSNEEIRSAIILFEAEIKKRTPDLIKMKQELSRTRNFIKTKTDLYLAKQIVYENLKKKTVVISLQYYKSIVHEINQICDETAIKQKEEAIEEHAIGSLKTRLEELTKLVEDGRDYLNKPPTVFYGYFGNGSAAPTE